MASCSGCDRKWTGVRQAHCSGCHEHFSSPFTFDAHQKRGKCLTPARVRVGGRSLVQKQYKDGPVWVLDMDGVYDAEVESAAVA